MSTHPLVSVLIPCHNAEQWIGQAIESALAQSYRPLEIIVVDDGSTDNSLSIIRRYADRIHFESGPNRGGGAARNRLLELSNGTWIQYLDADDYLLPDKIENQVQVVSEGTDVLFGPVLMQYEDEEGRQELLPISEPRDPWRLLALWELPQTGCPLWRKDALVAVGGWKADQRVCQEHELYSRLLMDGCTFEYSDVTGAVYRQWSNQTVCRKNVPDTYCHRLEIMQRVETHLIGKNQMTPVRRAAFNRAYLACSRIIWTFDPVWARNIMTHVHQQTEGKFFPEVTQVPRSYATLYRLFGFEFAERVAALKRQLSAR